jgi:two-component system OmpR family sensor kinase
MDGRSPDGTRSLTFQLSAWIAGVVLAVAACASVVSYRFAHHAANELQDSQLVEIATLVDENRLPRALATPHYAADADQDVRIVIQPLPGPGRPRVKSMQWLDLPADIGNGIHTVHLPDGNWRVFVRTLDTGERIAVAQDTKLRDAIARDGAVRTLLPLLALVPVLVVALMVLVRVLLKPVVRLSTLLDRQTEFDLHRLPEDVSTEIRPFVTSINRLIERLKRAIDAQNRFVANAAHELRTPIAALSLQAENLSSAALPAEARARLGVLRAGLQRARGLMEQLLTFARLQAQPTRRLENVSLADVVARALQDCVAIAERNAVDLSSTRLDKVQIVADAEALEVILRNLVDNAVRYTPAGGSVDVRAFVERESAAHGTTQEPSRDLLVIEIKDSGPGISDIYLKDVFAPFYRVPGTQGSGSGLGLAIVAETARRLDGTIDLHNEAAGMRARYTQPLAAAPMPAHAYAPMFGESRSAEPVPSDPSRHPAERDDGASRAHAG